MPGSENLDREETLRTCREQTARRMLEAAETILLGQDTASLNCNTHKKTEGIGYISGKTLGVNIHTCLAVTASGLVLGAADQNNREEARDERRTHESKKVRRLESRRRPAGGQNGLGRAHCAQYLACLPSLAGVILRVKFSALRRGLFISWITLFIPSAQLFVM
jgi:hypothetical protein